MALLFQRAKEKSIPYKDTGKKKLTPLEDGQKAKAYHLQDWAKLNSSFTKNPDRWAKRHYIMAKKFIYIVSEIDEDEKKLLAKDEDEMRLVTYDKDNADKQVIHIQTSNLEAIKNETLNKLEGLADFLYLWWYKSDSWIIEILIIWKYE